MAENTEKRQKPQNHRDMSILSTWPGYEKGQFLRRKLPKPTTTNK